MHVGVVLRSLGGLNIIVRKQVEHAWSCILNIGPPRRRRTNCVCKGETAAEGSGGRSELLVQNLARGARCQPQRQRAIIPVRLLPLLSSNSSFHETIVTQSPCRLPLQNHTPAVMQPLPINLVG